MPGRFHHRDEREHGASDSPCRAGLTRILKADRGTMRKVLTVLAVLAVCAPVCAGVWTEVELPINRKLRPVGPVYGITAHPRIAGLVFASSYWGTYRSSDWGFHWKRVEGLAAGLGFAFNPFDDREIWSGGLYVSKDLGTSFSRFADGPGIFDPRIPNRAYRLGVTH